MNDDAEQQEGCLETEFHCSYHRMENRLLTAELTTKLNKFPLKLENWVHKCNPTFSISKCSPSIKTRQVDFVGLSAQYIHV